MAHTRELAGPAFVLVHLHAGCILTGEHIMDAAGDIDKRELHAFQCVRACVCVWMDGCTYMICGWVADMKQRVRARQIKHLRIVLEYLPRTGYLPYRRLDAVHHWHWRQGKRSLSQQRHMDPCLQARISRVFLYF